MQFGAAAAILAFLAAFLAIFAVNLVLTDLFKRDRRKRIHQAEAQLWDRDRERARSSVKENREHGLNELAIEALNEQKRKGLFERIKELAEQSGMRITPLQMIVYGIGAGALTGFLAGFLLRSVIVGVLAFLVAAMIPLLIVASARKRRLEQLRSQLPDVLELMSRILRSGQTITQGMNAVAEEFVPPVSREFGYCYEQQNLGLSPEVALRDLASRTGLMEVKIFVLAVLVHRQSGGNLTELLDQLAHMVRQRFRIRGDIKAMTAEGRLQAAVLLALPVCVWIGLYFVNRPYALKLFEHPQLVVGTLISMVLGAFWIHKIVNFDF